MIVKIKLVPTRVYMCCDDCHEQMVEVPKERYMSMKDIETFNYRCDKCGKVYETTRRYPYIEYVEQ